MLQYARFAAIPIALCLLLPAAAWADSGTLSAPTVKLLDAGKGKKKTLRYQTKAGDKEAMQMDMDMTMSMTMNGQSLVDMRAPTVRMKADIEVAEVTGEGNFKLTFRYTEFDVLDTEGVAPLIKTSMEQALTGMDTVEGHAVMSNRGIVLSGSFDTTKVTNPQIQQLADSIEQSMQQLSAPLPAEAVGKGARWEVHTEFENNGITIQQVATYKLTQLTRNGFTCDIKIAQSAKPQRINAPGMPPNAQVDLISMNGSGTGKLDINLGRLTPTSHADLASAMKMGMQSGPQQQEMDIRMSIGIKFKPAR